MATLEIETLQIRVEKIIKMREDLAIRLNACYKRLAGMGVVTPNTKNRKWADVGVCPHCHKTSSIAELKQWKAEVKVQEAAR